MYPSLWNLTTHITQNCSFWCSTVQSKWCRWYTCQAIWWYTQPKSSRFLPCKWTNLLPIHWTILQGLTPRKLSFFHPLAKSKIPICLQSRRDQRPFAFWNGCYLKLKYSWKFRFFRCQLISEANFEVFIWTKKWTKAALRDYPYKL